MKHDSNFVGPTENSRRNHEIRPPMEPGVGTDSGKIIHGVAYPDRAPETKEYRDPLDQPRKPFPYDKLPDEPMEDYQ